MTKYDIPVWQMIYEATQDLPRIFRAIDVINKVRAKRPQVKENTIRCHVMGMAPNHSSSKWYGGRYKLLHFLGNGQYSLLPKEDIIIPTITRKLRIINRPVVSAPLDDAEKLLDAKLYKQAIKDYGSILEEHLRMLYERYFHKLPVQKQENILNYVKSSKTTIDRFTLGVWIGLFQCADLFRYIAQDKGRKEFVFFTSTFMNTLNELRNMSVHRKPYSKFYMNENSALFMKWVIKCILEELKA